MRPLACAALVALVAPASGWAWSWPVRGPVLRPFSFGSDPYAAGQHRGIDIGAPAGAPVLAPAGGTVSFAGVVPTGGKTVTIQTQDGYAVTLVHLGSYGVRRGAVVAEGDPVGSVGPSGVPELAVPYMYLGIRRMADEQGDLDPPLFLPQPGAAPVAPPATSEPVPPAAPAPAAAPPAAGAGGVPADPGTPAPKAEQSLAAEAGSVRAARAALHSAPSEAGAAPQSTVRASGAH